MSVPLDDSADELNALADRLEELLRARKIRRGINPVVPHRTVEQMRAETIALRARNDQALAEMRGAWRTYDD